VAATALLSDGFREASGRIGYSRVTDVQYLHILKLMDGRGRLFFAALAIRRPKGNLLKEALRLLPDLLRLLKRLTTDRTLPTGVRVRVALLFIYLAIPIDIIPDFIPVLGYADDVFDKLGSPKELILMQ
jgi:Protein of unknown function (DUF1232)